MKKMWIAGAVAAGLSLSMSAPVWAKPQESFHQYVQQLKAQAREEGIPQSTINVAFKNVKFLERVIAADNSQPEMKLTLAQYLEKAVPQWKIDQANRLYRENYTTLNRIGAEYGVQPKYIVALWGIESNFGKIQGNYNVIDALSTLAYEGRREKFFRGEVMDALKILEQEHIAPSKMKGSWAGAMGQCQFMPSSFLTFARDGNGDGHINIWTDKADVFASAANYLKKSGWNDEYTWGRAVKVTKSVHGSWLGLQSSKGRTLSEWRARGVEKINGQSLPNVNIKAWLIQPDGKNSDYYLVYNNYQVLLKWNRSNYFALAVSRLASGIHQ